MADAQRRRLQRVARALPGGGVLTDAVFERRHRGVLIVLWAHAFVISLYGIARGYSVAHSLLEGGAIAVLAAGATFVRGGRSARAALAALGLLSSSALLVHLSGGVIEMHFHFFVVIGILTLYQEWLPFLLAIGYVLLHHGLLGAIEPELVYNHGAAIRNPWLWSAIHGAFVLAASVASVLAWRLNEDSHERAEAYVIRLREEQLRQRQALEINDNVVQGLTVAKYALDAGNTEHAQRAVNQTLVSAREIVTDLLQSDENGDLKLDAGDLVRAKPARVAIPEPVE